MVNGINGQEQLEKNVQRDKLIWSIFYTFLGVSNYVFGIIGIVAGLLAAATIFNATWQTIFGIIAACMAGILGLIKPDQLLKRYCDAYVKIVSAWTDYLIHKDKNPQEAMDQLGEVYKEALKVANKI